MSQTVTKAVVVIGAGGEIGTLIAKGLVQDGFRVVATYRNPPAEAPECMTVFALDVQDRASVRRFFAEVENTFGAPFGLVYVAGCRREAPIALMSDEDWDEVLGVNLGGAFGCLRAAARSMMAGGGGRIVLVGSVSGSVGIAGQAAYAASKAGLEAIARVASLEFGRFGVCCNVVAPGAIDSGMFRTVPEAAVARILGRTSLRRLGTPAEVAGIVRFLHRPEAGYFTGQTIVMDGGLSSS